MMALKIIVNGANGRMGQETVTTISQQQEFEFVATGDRTTNLASLINQYQADIVIDFTVPEVVFENCQTIIDQGAHPVIGTSGLVTEQIQQLQQLAEAKQLGGLIAPNFSIGVALMTQFAKHAAQYYSEVEISELHHDKKLDSPSGTALKTAEAIASAQPNIVPKPSEQEIIPHARGAVYQGVHIHSIRLPGLLAHQEILFGSDAETLTLRHDTSHRRCFMPGVILACQKVTGLSQLLYGLENLL